MYCSSVDLLLRSSCIRLFVDLPSGKAPEFWWSVLGKFSQSSTVHLVTVQSLALEIVLQEKLTSPKGPLDSKMAFKLLGEKEVEDTPETGERESQPEGERQFFAFKPKGGDAVLHNSKSRGEISVTKRYWFLHMARCLNSATLMVRCLNTATLIVCPWRSYTFHL